MASRDQRIASDDSIINECMHENEDVSYQTKDAVSGAPIKSAKSIQKDTSSPTNLQNTSLGPYSASTLPAYGASKMTSNKNGIKSRLLTGLEKPMRLRIVLVGSERTGKSCLIKRYCEKRFVSKYMSTIGIDYGATKIYVDKREVSVHIFDTSGSALFGDVRNEFYSDAHGILLVFDLTRRETFEELTAWLDELRSALMARRSNQNSFESEPNSFPVILVCGNKKDLLDDTNSHVISAACVDDIEAKLWADVHGLQYCETSAKTGGGVGDMFHTFFSYIVKNQLEVLSSAGKLPKTPASARRVHLGGLQSSSKSSFPASPTTLSKTIHASSLATQTIRGGSDPTKEQDVIMKQLHTGKDSWEQLGVDKGCSREEVNKTYRKLAILLHPDKTGVKGADDAFKLLGSARRNILMTFNHA